MRSAAPPHCYQAKTVRTDETKSERLLARLGLTEDTGIADMKEDLGGELDFVDLGQTEAVLYNTLG